MSIYPATSAEILSRAFQGDPERKWGSARPEWLEARAGGRLDADGNIIDREAAPAGAGQQED